jgi:hypothetical protein
VTSVDLRFARSTTEPANALLLLFGAGGGSSGGGGTGPTYGPGALRTSVGAPWSGTANHRAAAAATWSPTSKVGTRGVTAPWRPTTTHQVARALPWGATVVGRRTVALPWGDTVVGRAVVAMPWRSVGSPVRAYLETSASAGAPRSAGYGLPWQRGLPILSWGGPWTQLPTQPPVPATCRTDDPADDLLLLFQTAAGPTPLALLFRCWKPAIVVVPVQETYVIVNATSLTRVSDSQDIPVRSMSLSLDADTWTWGFSASLPGDALPLIEPTTPGEPIALDAEINGTVVRVLVESIERERVFGRADVRINGRGLTALLDAPYAPVQVFANTADRTSQQLIDEILPVGWTATWDGVDPWLVPADAWSHRGTIISAATGIAAAVGGYLLPDPVAQSFKVRPRYPLGPWDWATLTPDFSLPSAVMVREGISWVEKPRYNRVWVTGTTAGVTARITRNGTGGDSIAPMVADALITHSDAARQRGLRVLSDVGRQAMVTQRLPVLDTTGILRPGHIVDYVDGASTRRGIVRSVSVSAEGLANVWQSVSIETNEG